MPVTSPRLKRGQFVRVRDFPAIASTLDQDGKLDGMPFMPEMAVLCGHVFQVQRRVFRTCVAGQGIRLLDDTVFLDSPRCNGGAHDDCQRNCVLFWKEVWLEPVCADAVSQPAPAGSAILSAALTVSRDGRYVCQSTELAAATQASGRWSILPFVREIATGDLRLRDFLALVLRTARHRLFGWQHPKPLRGTVGAKSRGALGLQTGDWVQVRTQSAIEATLNEQGNNCGLGFRTTMLPAIGQRHRVAFPVRQIILEQNGKMAKLSNTVALDGVVCEGACVNHCPRAEYLYWRECWLEPHENAQQNNG